MESDVQRLLRFEIANGDDYRAIRGQQQAINRRAGSDMRVPIRFSLRDYWSATGPDGYGDAPLASLYCLLSVVMMPNIRQVSFTGYVPQRFLAELESDYPWLAQRLGEYCGSEPQFTGVFNGVTCQGELSFQPR